MADGGQQSPEAHDVLTPHNLLQTLEPDPPLQQRRWHARVSIHTRQKHIRDMLQPLLAKCERLGPEQRNNLKCYITSLEREAFDAADAGLYEDRVGMYVYVLTKLADEVGIIMQFDTALAQGIVKERQLPLQTSTPETAVEAAAAATAPPTPPAEKLSWLNDEVRSIIFGMKNLGVDDS